MLTVRFGVKGHPEPAGSKKAVGGGRFTRIVDANPKAKGWQRSVANVAKVAMTEAFGFNPPVLEGPVYLRLEFLYTRPRTHLLTDGFSLSAAGRSFDQKTSKPDALKLARAVEDALTGVCYRDDAQIVEEFVTKRWATESGVNVIVSEHITQGGSTEVWGLLPVEEIERSRE